MKFPFDRQQGLVVIGAELTGPSGEAVVRLALDTGATGTVINAAVLLAIGCDPALAPARVQVTTGSGVEFVARLNVSRIAALGRERADFEVLCHTLPASSGVDGLLGLDFLQGEVLTVDFREHVVSLD